MWIITNFGFFSVVEKPGQKNSGMLTVRSRVRGDLETLRRHHLPTLGNILTDKGTDYKYRAAAPAKDVAGAFAKAILGINYANFKDSVAAQQGSRRAETYHGVWDQLWKLADEDTTRATPEPSADLIGEYDQHGQPLPRAYGGVVFDEQGRVLLRKPKGEFDGYVWTFPKGRENEGESQIETAVREVKEETGIEAKPTGSRIPFVFRGGTTANVYYLMTFVKDHGDFDLETEKIAWATIEQASELISQTRNSIGRRRDLAVLEQAVRWYGKWQEEQ